MVLRRLAYYGETWLAEHFNAYLGYERDTAERGRRGCGAGQRSMGRLLMARWRSAAVGKA